MQQHGPALQDDDALRSPRGIVHTAGRGDHRPACGMEPPAEPDEVAYSRRVQLRGCVVDPAPRRFQRQHRSN
ncbi:hypothetical protein P4H71_10000, partial [Paenibacillus kribbensis]|uniref:hypothetical protein n=1 Tax=Paenibacillus kribbensis TaxID=172713 RepID=UPI002DBC7FFA